MYTPGLMNTSSFVGTHKFLPPEVVNGSQGYDGRKVDIWAAGVTLFNMLTGLFPFDTPADSTNSPNSPSLYDAIMNDPLVIPVVIDDDLECQDLLHSTIFTFRAGTNIRITCEKSPT
jgi:serine/threonine protein kinase